MAAVRIAMVAGEASGDLLGSRLIETVRRRIPAASFVGIGGPRMIAAGFESWFPQEKLAVRGFVEVLRHLREILARPARARPARPRRAAAALSRDRLARVQSRPRAAPQGGRREHRPHGEPAGVGLAAGAGAQHRAVGVAAARPVSVRGGVVSRRRHRRDLRRPSARRRDPGDNRPRGDARRAAPAGASAGGDRAAGQPAVRDRDDGRGRSSRRRSSSRAPRRTCASSCRW